MVAVVATVGLTSCGGGSPEDLAQEMCDCMKEAGTDTEAMQKCSTDMAQDHAKSIGTDKDALEAYSKKMQDCAGEIAKEMAE